MKGPLTQCIPAGNGMAELLGRKMPKERSCRCPKERRSKRIEARCGRTRTTPERPVVSNIGAGGKREGLNGEGGRGSGGRGGGSRGPPSPPFLPSFPLFASSWKKAVRSACAMTAGMDSFGAGGPSSHMKGQRRRRERRSGGLPEICGAGRLPWEGEEGNCMGGRAGPPPTNCRGKLLWCIRQALIIGAPHHSTPRE